MQRKMEHLTGMLGVKGGKKCRKMVTRDMHPNFFRIGHVPADGITRRADAEHHAIAGTGRPRSNADAARLSVP